MIPPKEKRFYPKLDQGGEFPHLVMERGNDQPVGRFLERHQAEKIIFVLNGETEQS